MPIKAIDPQRVVVSSSLATNMLAVNRWGCFLWLVCRSVLTLARMLSWCIVLSAWLSL